MLITYGTMIRASAIKEVGNFNSSLRYKEDQELGERLFKIGYFMVGDPLIKIFPIRSNTLVQVLERYARWYMDTDEKPSLRGYIHNIKSSIRPMMQEDLQAGDPVAALISLLTPHFQLYHSLKAFRKTMHERKQKALISSP